MTIDLGGLIRDAIDRSAYEHKAIAYGLGYHADYWSRVLTGDRGMTLDRLGRLPVDLQRAIVAAWGAQIGVPIERRERIGASSDALALAELLTVRRVRITVEAL